MSIYGLVDIFLRRIVAVITVILTVSNYGCQLILHWRLDEAKKEKQLRVRQTAAAAGASRLTVMAAEIHSRPQTARPVLLNKIEGHSDAVNAAVLIPKEDGVITVSEDRSVR